MGKIKTLGEAAGKVYLSNGLGDESLLLENAIEARKREKDEKKAAELLIAAEKAKQEELLAKMDKLELIPLGPRVIILPYTRNPYRKTITESGILIDYEGSFKNPESGESDKLPDGIKCAKVIEVGPDTKFLKEGDDIFYDARTIQPIPFFLQGYYVVAEQNVLTVINEGLKERFKK